MDAGVIPTLPPPTPACDGLPPALAAAFEAQVKRGELSVALARGMAGKILEETLHEEPDLARLAEWLESDPGLTTATLNAANSAFFGLRMKVQTVERALAQLGSVRAREVLLLALSRAAMFTVREFKQEMLALREHSVATGIWSRAIAAHLGQPPATAFACGLLHEVGRPVALQELSTLSRLSRVKLNRATLWQTAASYRDQVGLVLVRSWADVDLLETVQGTTHRAIPRTVAFAKRIAALDFGWGDTCPVPETSAELAAEANLGGLLLTEDHAAALLSMRERALSQVQTL
ncbi:MAG: HDOD domain-containing protein [Polyangiaceae bacterium]|nr:HDOD domain-containing protein [Polyangiaceae bacterium]MCB9605341.1 HDOD domain-containing protein [Polyangiaceae bacterium]